MGYINAAALHGQSSTDLNISANKTHKSVKQIAPKCPSCPTEVSTWGLRVATAACARPTAGLCLRNLPVPVLSGLDLDLSAACPPDQRARH